MMITKSFRAGRVCGVAALTFVTFGAWPVQPTEAAPKRSTRTYKRKKAKRPRVKKRRTSRARRYPRIAMPKPAFPVMTAPRPLPIDAIPARTPIVMHPDRAPGDPKNIMRVGSQTKVIQIGGAETPTRKPEIIDTSKPPETEKAAPAEGTASEGTSADAKN